MKRIIIKVLSALLCSTLIAGTAITAGAASNITSNGGSGDSKVTITTASQPIKVTVPSVLPIWVDSDNNVTVATNAKITNLSAAPVDVTDVSVEADNNWSLVDFNTDFTKIPVDTKQFGMTMYDDDVIDGVDLSLFDRIGGSDEIAVIYDGNVAIQSSDINKLDIGHVVFTVAWAAREDHSVIFSGMNTDAAAFMASPDYDMSDRSYTYVPETFSVENPDKPNVGLLELPDGAATVTLLNLSRGIEWTNDVTGKSEYEIKNLIPNEQYTYTVKDSSGAVLQTDMTVQSGSLRMIDGGANTENIRDLGGLRADGGVIAYNKIYRGAQLLSSLSSEQQDYFKDFLGINVDLDFREDSDGACEAVFTNGIEWQNRPVFGGLGGLNVALSWNPNNVAALQTLIEDIVNYKTVYMHCQAGADRTQIVSMLTLALCGVSESDIEKQFELSSFAGRDRRRTNTDNTVNMYFEALQRLDSYIGITLQQKVISWALKSGITMSEINSLRHALIDGNPVELNENDYIYQNVLSNDTLTFGKVINASDGRLVTLKGFACTDFIKVDSEFLNTELEVITDTEQTGAYAMLVEYFNDDKTTISNSNKYDVTVEELPNGLYRYRYPLWKYMGSRSYDETSKPWLRLNFKYNDASNVQVSVVKY